MNPLRTCRPTVIQTDISNLKRSTCRGNLPDFAYTERKATKGSFQSRFGISYAVFCLKKKTFYPDAKIGVLGVNGAGKSTLLKIMAGIDKEYTGEAWVAEGARVGYLEQEPKLDPALSVRENVMLGVAAIQLACIGWVIGTSYAKRHPLGDDPFRSAALQMVFSGSMLLAAATAHGDWAHLSFTTKSMAAMLYLSVAGSIVAYSAYIYAIQHLPLQFVSLYAYINPMIAVALGTVLLGEPFSMRIVAAAVLVLAGTWIVSRRR